MQKPQGARILEIGVHCLGALVLAKEEGTERLHMEVRGPVKAVTKALRDVPGVQDVTYIEGDDGAVGYTIIGKRGEEMRTDLAKAVIEQRWGLLSLEELTMKIEADLELVINNHRINDNIRKGNGLSQRKN